MSENKKNKKTVNTMADKILAKRKLIMLLLFFVILPVVCISTLYIGTYVENKPEIFSDYDAEYVSLKTLEENFDFDLYVSKYTEPTFDSEGSTTSSGSLKFSLTVGSSKSSTIVSSSVTVRLVAAANWINYTSNTTTSTITFGDSTTATISSFNQEFPQNPLFLVNVTKKDVAVYALLTWNEKPEGSTVYEEINVIVKFSYSDYVVKDTNFE